MGTAVAKWIQRAIKRPNSLRKWMMKHYGRKAFTKRGTIKYQYLLKARADVKSGRIRTSNKRRILGKIQLALNLRKFRK